MWQRTMFALIVYKLTLFCFSYKLDLVNVFAS